MTALYCIPLIVSSGYLMILNSIPTTTGIVPPVGGNVCMTNVLAVSYVTLRDQEARQIDLVIQ